MRSALLCLLWVLGCSKAPGRVTGNAVRCEADGGLNETVGSCVPAFQQFARQHPNDRVSDVTLIYGPSEAELIVWITDDKQWPQLRDVHAENIACDGPGQPSCKIALESRSREPHRQLFVSMVAAVQETSSETIGFLDFYTPGENSGPTTVVDVACHLDKGDDWVTDEQQLGVTRANFFAKQEFASSSPTLCDQALYKYLRAHPDQHIRWVEQEDRPVADPLSQGTSSLLIAVDALGRAQTPRDMIIRDLVCIERPCSDEIIRFRDGREALFSVPIAKGRSRAPRTDHLLVVSRLR